MRAAIIYAKLAPFHVSRLEATGSLGRSRGYELHGVEVAGLESACRWRTGVAPGIAYSRVTLFPEQDIGNLSYRQIRREVHGALDAWRPNVVVLPGWGTAPGVAGLSWCLRNGVPRVLISDSQPIDNAQIYVKTRIKELVVRRYQAGFAAGHPQLRYLVELGLAADACFFGCDVVDNEFFNVVAPTRDGNFAPALLSCLRLIPQKNILTVLEVLAKAATQWTWRIAGEGPLRPRIEERVRMLGLQERVHLLGHVDYDLLPQLYASADAYLQPSISETWGLAVNEAMAAGLPVIVSRQCGCREDLVEEGRNGLMFDPFSASDLAGILDGMLKLRGDWHRMGEASRAIIGRWGLDMFATNFWRACETALHVQARPLSAQLADRAVGRVL